MFVTNKNQNYCFNILDLKVSKNHIGQRHVNSNICLDSEVHIWEDKRVWDEKRKHLYNNKHKRKIKILKKIFQELSRASNTK